MPIFTDNDLIDLLHNNAYKYDNSGKTPYYYGGVWGGVDPSGVDPKVAPDAFVTSVYGFRNIPEIKDKDKVSLTLKK